MRRLFIFIITAMFTATANLAMASVRDACAALAPQGVVILTAERARAPAAAANAGFINVDRGDIDITPAAEVVGAHQRGIVSAVNVECDITATIIAPNDKSDNGDGWLTTTADAIAHGAHRHFIAARHSARVDSVRQEIEQVSGFVPYATWSQGDCRGTSRDAASRAFVYCQVNNNITGCQIFTGDEPLTGSVPSADDNAGNWRLRIVSAGVEMGAVIGSLRIVADNEYPPLFAKINFPNAIAFIVGSEENMHAAFNGYAHYNSSVNDPADIWHLERGGLVNREIDIPVRTFGAPAAEYSLELTGISRADGGDIDDEPRALVMTFRARWNGRYG